MRRTYADATIPIRMANTSLDAVNTPSGILQTKDQRREPTPVMKPRAPAVAACLIRTPLFGPR